MSSKRKAKKVMKLYGKEIIKQRAAFADSFSEEYVPGFRKIRYKRMFKRIALTMLILIMTLSLIVATANAVGIKIFNFSFFETSTHTELINENEKTSNGNTDCYYKPTVIPDNYSFITTDEIEGAEINYIYENDKKQNLVITESYNTDLTTMIDNEKCKISTEVIGENEIKIYAYENGRSVYLLQKGKTFIMIDGTLSETEFKEIITGLEIKK